MDHVAPADPADGRAPGSPDAVGCETWVSQGEAAAQTGFSVSAIRKWRRMGIVADRKVTGAGGSERVEVNLDDVLARTALQSDRRRGEPVPSEVQARPRSVVITIDDLEALFERMVEAEHRAERAEAELEALRSENRFTFGQLSELRRQLQAFSGQPANGQPLHPSPPRVVAPPAPLPAPPAPPDPVHPVTPTPVRVPRDTVTNGSGTGRSEVRERRPPPDPEPGRAREEDRRDGERLEQLAARLRQRYARLDEYRREEVITPAAERQRQRHLAEYDRLLVTLCQAMGIPGGEATPPLTLRARAGLTRALAQAGLDVRAAVVESGRSTGGPGPEGRV